MNIAEDNHYSGKSKLSEDWPYLLFDGKPYPLEVGEGWHSLVAETFKKIVDIYRKKNVPLEWFSVMQIKEKFGGLRIYTGALPASVYDDVDRIIDEAEKKSVTICEVCGEPGKLITTGWWNTRCPKHTGGKD